MRPDYAVETSRCITGFLELKAPGHDVTPDGGFTKRDREQWELMRGPRWPGTSPVPAGTTGAQVRPDPGSCGGDAVGVLVGALGSVEDRDAAQPVLRVSKLSNLVFGAGDAV